MDGRPDPLTAAHMVAAERFPDADAVLAGGSVFRGQGTPTSDLDIIVITGEPPAPCRETFEHAGWTVEAFVHSERTLPIWAMMDIEERVPILARIATEGEVVADRTGIGARLREEMRTLLDNGPRPMTDAELERVRYEVTDALDDLRDSGLGLERLVLTGEVAEQAARLVFIGRGEWWGRGKWAMRRIRSIDPGLSSRLLDAASESLEGDAEPLIRLTEQLLAPLGGRLLHGYRADGTDMMERWLRSRADSDP